MLLKIQILKKIIFQISFVILLVNIYGTFLPLKAYFAVNSNIIHKNNIPLLESQETKKNLKDLDLENISKQDLKRINYLFAGSIKNFWPDSNFFEFSENWIIFLLQRISLKTEKKILKIERFKWNKIVERGYGLCSQSSLALYDFLKKKNFNPLLVSLGDHVVVNLNSGEKNYILDPDYNVIFESELSNLYFNSDIIDKAYKSAGYPQNVVNVLKKIYLSREDNWIGTRSEFYPDLTKFYYLVNFFKWFIPILIITILKFNEISKTKE